MRRRSLLKAALAAPLGLLFGKKSEGQPEAKLSLWEEFKRDGGGCYFAGPDRGDCEHFVGLPGKSIPNQHDGDDDTVDLYGKPNGWCWFCWHSHEIRRLQHENRILTNGISNIDASKADWAGPMYFVEWDNKSKIVRENEVFTTNTTDIDITLFGGLLR